MLDERHERAAHPALERAQPKGPKEQQPGQRGWCDAGLLLGQPRELAIAADLERRRRGRVVEEGSQVREHARLEADAHVRNAQGWALERRALAHRQVEMRGEPGRVHAQDRGPQHLVERVAVVPGSFVVVVDVVDLDLELAQPLVEVVGPAVSSELRMTGFIAVAAGILAIVAYVWFRFEWQFALGAVLALSHDVIVTVGIFALFQFEFDLSTVAALLTILGYSVNDTVVVSDRIRENLRKFKKMELNQLLNLSINETLSRTILTGMTALAVLISLYVFGGEVIRNFNLAMLLGVVIGTYSSIFIAAPLLGYLGVKRDWSDMAAKAVAASKTKAKA